MAAIKIAHEGYETAVIHDAATIIARQKSLILFEQWGSRIADGASPTIERHLGYAQFCSVQMSMPSRVPKGLPNSRRLLGRFAGLVILGVPDRRFSLNHVELLNQRAAQLGATHTHVANPHGLHAPDHYTTARDLALITRAAMQQHVDATAALLRGFLA